MKLSDLVSKTKAVSFDFDGDAVTLEVRTSLVTPKLVADLAAMDDDKVPAATRMLNVSEQLARIVASWDVLDNDGTTMFPLTVDRLSADIPVSFQMRCLMAAIGAMQGEVNAPKDVAA